jgi:hypothetical protein
LSGQSDAREDLFSSIFGALIEEATLAKRLLQRVEYAGEPAFLHHLAARVGELEREAAQVCDWLHAMGGLVEPDPLSRAAQDGVVQTSVIDAGAV